MKNLKIRVKLLISFISITVLTIAVGLIGAVGLTTAEKKYSETITQSVGATSALANIREDYLQQRLALRSMALNIDDQDALESNLETLREYEASILKDMEIFEGIITNENIKSVFSSFKNNYLTDYSQIKLKLIEVLDAGQLEEVSNVYLEGNTSAGKLIADLQSTIELVGQSADDAIEDGSDEVESIKLAQITTMTFGIALALTLCMYISSIINQPIKHMTKVFNQFGKTGNLGLDKETAATAAKYSQQKDEIGELAANALRLIMHLNEVERALVRVAEGDLTVEMEILSDTDNMGLSVARVLTSMNNMFSEIHNASTQVAAGSGQISDGAQALAEGSTEQAAAIEELLGSISAIAVKTKENSDMAARASGMAGAIKQNAEKGSAQMGQMLAAVKEIQEASMSIGKVIKVIDDIAFQTNILALNAAVEAARAGQHGKGFAVVAEEVRNLAAKSAEAARDTGTLIANSMAKAELGARIAGETAESLAEIVEGVNESGHVVSEIAQSSEEQSVAIVEVNKGIEQVAQVVQANSAAAQESAAASEEMSSQSSALEKLIGRFKIKDVPIE